MIDGDTITSEGEKFLNETVIPIRFAPLTDSGWPMLLSLWFKYSQGKFYLATIKSAKVVEYVKNNSRCAFEIAKDKPPYKGIRGQGVAKIIPELGTKVLKELLTRYKVKMDSNLAKFLLSRAKDEVAIEIKPITLYAWDFTPRMKNAFREDV